MKRTNYFGFFMNPVLKLFVLSIFLAFSCTSEEEIVNMPQDDVETLVSWLEETGFHRDEIVLEGDLFVIDGHILIAKEEVEKFMALPFPSFPDGRLEHYRSRIIVSNTYVTNIRIFIESSVPTAWNTAVRDAVNQWNAINGTKLSMSVVTSSSQAHIRVNTGYSTQNWVARAYLPFSNGHPGNLVTINTRYNSLSSGYKLFTMVHELGHTIGFYHTNQNQGIFIEGTPVSDANSVMNSFILQWRGFTAGDIAAVQILYPL